MSSGGVGSEVNFNQGKRLEILRIEILKLMKAFQSAGAVELAVPSLLDTDVLIDLYGEDIRSRAYTTSNLFGEKSILRPDFTVPIVQMHIASKKKNGKYSYAGYVWRSQPQGSKNPVEYYQVGLEFFHENAQFKADAELFKIFYSCVEGLELNFELGDMALLRAIVTSLDISENKKRLLLRHLWRPDRFKQLLKQLSAGYSITDSRSTLFQAIKSEQMEDYIRDNGPVIGSRSVVEIIKRSKDLLLEGNKKPIPQEVVSRIERLQTLNCSLVHAPEKLYEFLDLGKELGVVCEQLSNRIKAIEKLGIDLTKLNFVTNLTRTTLEYYDGFIFAGNIKGSSYTQPLVQGGRYNALTSIIGKGISIPAVGGIIRPELLISAREEA